MCCSYKTFLKDQLKTKAEIVRKKNQKTIGKKENLSLAYHIGTYWSPCVY